MKTPEQRREEVLAKLRELDESDEKAYRVKEKARQVAGVWDKLDSKTKEKVKNTAQIGGLVTGLVAGTVVIKKGADYMDAREEAYTSAKATEQKTETNAIGQAPEGMVKIPAETNLTQAMKEAQATNPIPKAPDTITPPPTNQAPEAVPQAPDTTPPPPAPAVSPAASASIPTNQPSISPIEKARMAVLEKMEAKRIQSIEQRGWKRNNEGIWERTTPTTMGGKQTFFPNGLLVTHNGKGELISSNMMNKDKKLMEQFYPSKPNTP